MTTAYTAKNTITLQIDTSVQTAATYFVLTVTKNYSKNYDLLLNVEDFSIKHNQFADSKYLEISGLYFMCLFPIAFRSEQNQTLTLANYDAIRKRIRDKNKILEQEYTGTGFEVIRESFMQLDSEQKMDAFVQQQHFVQAFRLTLQKNTVTSGQLLEWSILPIGNVSWRGNAHYDPDNSCFTYRADCIEKAPFAALLQQYTEQHFLKTECTETTAEQLNILEHRTQYEPESFTFTNSETQLQLKIGNWFSYEETLVLNTSHH